MVSEWMVGLGRCGADDVEFSSFQVPARVAAICGGRTIVGRYAVLLNSQYWFGCKSSLRLFLNIYFSWRFYTYAVMGRKRERRLPAKQIKRTC